MGTILTWILVLMLLVGSWREITATTWLDIASGAIVMGAVLVSQYIASRSYDSLPIINYNYGSIQDIIDETPEVELGSD